MKKPPLHQTLWKGIVDFVGIAEHDGHAKTFKIRTEDTLKIIHHSYVHAATDPALVNLSADGVCTECNGMHIALMLTLCLRGC